MRMALPKDDQEESGMTASLMTHRPRAHTCRG